MIRVNPPIPLETDKGWGWAHFVWIGECDGTTE